MFEGFSLESLGVSSKLEERVVFFFVTVGIITITYGFFALIDFLPEKPQPKEDVSQIAEVHEERGVDAMHDMKTEEISAGAGDEITFVQYPLPSTIVFDSLDGKEVAIQNPQTDSLSVLDQALLSGAVRHPESADFERTGTMLIFGHSSYLPNVMNKNFQAFNGIQKLAWGDTIRVRSADREYVYSVDRVYEAKAEDAAVAITYGEPKLILATCNSFATKDDRFVVEAVFIESKPL